ncbi:hypothetical protein HOG21_04670 [bacterium]|nr:hypothetical protein [bacterium]
MIVNFQVLLFNIIVDGTEDIFNILPCSNSLSTCLVILASFLQDSKSSLLTHNFSASVLSIDRSSHSQPPFVVSKIVSK